MSESDIKNVLSSHPRYKNINEDDGQNNFGQFSGAENREEAEATHAG